MEDWQLLGLMGTEKAGRMIEMRSKYDDMKLRNRLMAKQAELDMEEQKAKASRNALLTQDPFGGYNPQMPSVQPPQQPPMMPNMPQGQPGPQNVSMNGAPQQGSIPGPNPEQMRLQQKYNMARQMTERVIATKDPDLISRHFSRLKSDPDFADKIPADFEVFINPKDEIVYKGTQDIAANTVKSPYDGSFLPAGKYKIESVNGRLQTAEPVKEEEKNLTTEQVVRKAEKERLGREPTGQELLDAMNRQKKGGEEPKLTEEQLVYGAEKERLGREPTKREILKAMEEHKQRGSMLGGDIETQVREIGDAIMNGEQSPMITGFGMAKIAAPLRAYLAKKGYNLRAAELDFKATERHLATLNGTQQTRLRQAVTFAYDSLDIVEELAKKWKGGKFPPLNKVNLLAARNGVYGPEAQSISTQLETQIADLTSELGTVYKGGNSSTDESLKLAAKNLVANWSEKQLLDNVGLVRRNLAIRQNSIKATGVAGLSTGDNAPPKGKERGAVVERRKSKSGRMMVKYADGTIAYEGE